MPIRPCKVLIAGAGLAGLTLALIFDKTGIDYTLLEAHPDVLSKAGAGISMLTNGLRILDQLGCYEELLRVVEAPQDATCIRSPEGEELTVADNLNAVFEKRFVVPIIVTTTVLFANSVSQIWVFRNVDGSERPAQNNL